MSYLAANLPSDKHCFFGAEGGVSQGLYVSLNVNRKSADSPKNIRRNLEIIAARYNLGFENLMLLDQGVTSHTEYIERPTQWQLTADGVVTGSKDSILCIATADCAPVLFRDDKAGLIGAAHAGWRGAVRGILENTLKIMLGKGASPDNIAVAVGPCLQQPSFETGLDMYDEFINAAPDNRKYFTAGKDAEHFQFDMESFIVDKLRALGLKNISASHIDTYAAEGKFFSFRRNTHLGLIGRPGDFPVHLSTIIL